MSVVVTDGISRIKCRFGCDDPVVIVYAPEGCICWADPVQALCAQHLAKIESVGTVTILVKAIPPSNMAAGRVAMQQSGVA